MRVSRAETRKSPLESRSVFAREEGLRRSRRKLLPLVNGREGKGKSPIMETQYGREVTLERQCHDETIGSRVLGEENATISRAS